MKIKTIKLINHILNLMEANYNNVINLTKEKLLKAFELSPENKWEEVENKEGFVVCTRTNPENGK